MGEVHIPRTTPVPVNEINLSLELFLCCRGGSLQVSTELAKPPIELAPYGKLKLESLVVHLQVRINEGLLPDSVLQDEVQESIFHSSLL